MKITACQRRLIVMVVTGWILITLMRQTNHLLAPTGLSIWLGGLLIAFAALHLNPKTGFTACLIIGMMLDAWAPLGFGTHAVLFGAAQIIVVRIRRRFAASELTIGIIVALIINLILFVMITFIVIGRSHGGPISGVRLLTDLVVSQVVLALIAPWYFALQHRALSLVLNPRSLRGRVSA
tara:strand:- start:4177 stop:4716 length:540 start_codon:yes stop_codon:yes gene_type:complete